MRHRNPLPIGACALVLCTTVLVGAASAERLAVRRFTTGDGLAGDYIVNIDRDSRGFLWFSTRDGLSVFDGQRFTSYGIADGLPIATINRVLETRAGVYWIATNGGGLCRFNPRGRRPVSSDSAEQTGPSSRQDEMLFAQFAVADARAANRINDLFEDRAGRLWVGTDGGLFRIDSGDRIEFTRVDIMARRAEPAVLGVHKILQDTEGSVWVGGEWGLTRLLPDGRAVLYRIEPASARDIVESLIWSGDGELWVAYRNGLLALATKPASSFSGESHAMVQVLPRSGGHQPGSAQPTGALEAARWYTTADGLPDDWVQTLMRGSDGRIWAGTLAGLSVLDGQRFRAYTTAHGLTDNYVTALATDRAGNIWIGTVAGVTRVIPHGLVTFGESDGLGHPRVRWLGQDPAGRLVVVSGDYVINRFEDARLISSRPNLPLDARCAWMSPCGYLDHEGDWWLSSTAGLYRIATQVDLADAGRRPPRAVYSSRHGLPGNSVFNVFEDRNGDVWVGMSPGGIVQWQRAGDVWRVYTEADGLPPPFMANMASAFVEDPSGNLWIGFYDGGLARWRHGRFQIFDVSDGVPVGMISSLYRDQSGRVWIGSTQAGLARIEDADADRPRFAALPASQQLNVRCIVDDEAGNIYAGTSRGVYRVDPESGRMRHYGIGEGLASEFVTAALRDRQGMLWFGTISGLSRLDPRLDPPSSRESPSPALISALRIRGQAEIISALGEAEPAPLTLAPDQNQLEIEFFGLAFDAGDPVRYQYRMAGVDLDWSPATELRSVNYGRLPPGSHRFEVRRIGSGGAAVGEPAAVRVTILPPFYARWWFVSLVALLVGGTGWALYRARVAQLLRVERVRARIATDLHDDIGASLSQMAILAEVARREPGDAQADVGASLERIAETSRDLIDSMADIVWAVNPDADSLVDLVHRMRRFAEDTLNAIDIDLTFHAPDQRQDLRLGADLKREVYLILKESVTNIAKHAACTSVVIELTRDRHHLRLRVADNGTGFDPGARTDGHGVASMRRRVAALGGTLDVESQAGQGTTIRLDIDLRRLPA